MEKNKELFKQAELFLRKAIELDSGYVAPYVGLGWIFNVAHGNLDSGLYYANRALHFEKHDPNVLTIKGWILMMQGFYVESKKVNEQAVKFSPNHSVGYQMLATLGFHTGEYASSISYFLKALNLGVSNYEKGNTLKSLCSYLYMYGFYEDGLKFAEKQIEFNNDSGIYFIGKTCTHLRDGNDSLAWVNSIHAQNWKAGTWWRPWYVATAMKNPKAGYAVKTLEVIKNQGSPFSVFLGYAWLINGENEKAKQEFEITIKNQLKVIEEQKENTTGLAYLYLLDICAVMGNNKKALEYIRLFQGCSDYFITPFMLNEYKTHSRFENIRKEPEFMKFLNKHDDRIQPEMKKIEKILKNYWSEN